VHWTEEDGETLAAENEVLEKKRFQEWQRKELVLSNVMEAELSFAAINGGDESVIEFWRGDLPYPMLPITGPTPWYRKAPVISAAQASEEMATDQQVEGNNVGEWVEGVEKQEQEGKSSQVMEANDG
ncbi:MAG: hypothetical protein Q9218_004785, partial [Villophora microphyllina]